MNQTLTEKSETPDNAPIEVSFWQAFLFWLKLGFISFGGPAGQISIMHQELVERRRWISERRFLHALNYCMLLGVEQAVVSPAAISITATPAGRSYRDRTGHTG